MQQCNKNNDKTCSLNINYAYVEIVITCILPNKKQCILIKGPVTHKLGWISNGLRKDIFK